MNGYGVYTWKDGRKYEGQFLNDCKHGYGVYEWADHRVYKGWWYEGKQYGLGSYINPNEEDKNGLWDNGKRIVWFTDEQVKKIIAKQMDYRDFLENAQNRLKCDADNGFAPPTTYKEGQRLLKESIEQYKSKPCV